MNNKSKKNNFGIFFIIFFLSFFWIYTNVWIYIDTPMAPIYVRTATIISPANLYANHSPEYPNANDLVHFKSFADVIGVQYPCSNCSIVFVEDIGYVNKRETTYYLNETGEIEFHYNPQLSWIKVDGYNTTLFYRVPAPNFWEKVDIMFKKYPLSLFVNVATLLGSIGVVGMLYHVAKIIRGKYLNKKNNFGIAS